MNLNLKNKLIDHRYKVLKYLGQGGMGTVFLVEDILNRTNTLALKILNKDIVSEKTLKVFKKEFDIMTSLKHPNLVQVFDFGNDKPADFYYITMEYITGPTLIELLSEGSVLPPDESLDVFILLCRVLNFIHSRKILHRDIKPNNIIIQKDNIKLMDFGLADIEQIDIRTKGTLQYFAPEILRGKIDKRVDIYALGITLYQLLTGKTFYGASATKSTIEFIKDDNNFSIVKSEALKIIENPFLKSIINKMTSFDPDDRYQTCSEIILDINKKLGKNFPLETAETSNAYVLGAKFVGRTDELQKLKQGIKESSNKIIFVHGDPGIGKSRLSNEFKKYSQLQNFLFIDLFCTEIKTKVLGPFLYLIKEILMFTDSDFIKKYGPEIKKILPTHKSLQNIKENQYSDPEIEQTIIINSITDFLLDHFKRQGKKTIIHIDNLQWIGETCMKILEKLIFKADKIYRETGIYPNFSLYLSGRDEGLYKIEKFKDRVEIYDIKLYPFNEKNVEEYIQSVFGENEIDTTLKKAIPILNEKVGGNPFFLQELIRNLVDMSFINRSKARWTITSQIEKAVIPDNLKDLIQKRLKHLNLSNEKTNILNIICLLNRPVSWDELNKIVSIKSDVLNHFEFLEILKSIQIEENIVYQIIHDLIKEIIIEKIKDKKNLHQIIAEKLEIIHKDKIDNYNDELAFHYSQANNKEKAVKYLKRAGDQARFNYENQKAIKFYDILLGFLNKNDVNEKIDVLLKKGRVLDIVGRFDECLKVREEAVFLSEKINDSERLAKSNLQLGAVYWKKGDFDTAILFYKRSLKLFEELDNKLHMSHVYGNMGNAYLKKDNCDEAMNCYLKQLKICEQLGDDNGISLAFSNMGIVHKINRKYDVALECYEKSMKIRDTLGDKHSVAITLGNVGNIYQTLGDLKAASIYYKNSLKIKEELGAKRSIAIAIGNIGGIHLEKGEYNEALECFKKYYTSSEELGDEWSVAISADLMGKVYREQGEYDKSLIYFDKIITISEKIVNKYLEALGNIHKASVLFLLQNYIEAQKINASGLKSALEINRKEIIFEGTLLASKIEFVLGNQEKAEHILLNLSKSIENNIELADLYYCLWKITSNNEYYVKALEYFKEINKDSQKIEDIKKLEDLQKGDSAYKSRKKYIQNIGDTRTINNKEDTDMDSLVFMSNILHIIEISNKNYSSDFLFEEILSHSIDLLEARRGLMILFDNNYNLKVKIALDSDKKYLNNHEEIFSYIIINKIIETGKPILENNFPGKIKNLNNPEILSVICIPLGKRYENGTVKEMRKYSFPLNYNLMGFIYMDRVETSSTNKFTANNMKKLHILVDIASAILLKENQNEKFITDQLTHLYLRPYFEKFLDNELLLNNKNKSHISVLMVDIDNFKSINDTFGHQISDEILTTISQLFINTLRSTDICGRHGGDEFVIILPNTDIIQAETVAIKLMDKVRTTKFINRDITICIGITSYPELFRNQNLNISAKELIKSSDIALFYAKKRGYDRYEICSENMFRTKKKHTTISDILTGNPIKDYRNIQMLLEAIKVANSTLDIEILLNGLLDVILELTDAERGMIMLYDKNNDDLKIESARDRHGNNIVGKYSYSKSITQKVFETLEPVFLNEVNENIATVSMLELDLRSVMCIPIQTIGHGTGVIYVDSKIILKEFTQVELLFFNAIGVQVAGAIENIRLHKTELEKEMLLKKVEFGKEIKKKKDELEKINAIVKAINREVKFKDILQKILNEILIIEGAENASVLIRNSEREVFTYRVSVGLDISETNLHEFREEDFEKLYFNYSEYFSDGIYLITDFDPKSKHYIYPYSELPKSLLIMKIIIDKNVEGYLILDNLIQKDAFKIEDIELLRNLKEHIISAFLKGKMLGELRKLNNDKDEFMGITAHDLRNPLQVIKTCAELIHSGFLKNKNNTEHLIGCTENILKASDFMLHLIKQLLEINALDVGKIQMDKKAEDVIRLLKDKEITYKRKALKKDLNFAIEYPVNLPLLFIDRTMFILVINNLLDNAFKYTYPGGKITVYFLIEKTEVIINVKDTGQGLDKEDLKEIFKKFKTLSSRPTAGETSTGLGLAIVKKIITVHGGNIWVKSKKGKGSIFSFSLPIYFDE